MPLALATIAYAEVMARVATILGIAAEGAPIALGSFAVGILLILAGIHWLGLAMVIVAIALAAFLRDPDRTAPARCRVR